ncbi:hypothetical protein EUTSA_v100213921mg, partial [Eutrema salsugineum]|jgi:hypothetical protein
MMKT